MGAFARAIKEHHRECVVCWFRHTSTTKPVFIWHVGRFIHGQADFKLFGANESFLQRRHKDCARRGATATATTTTRRFEHAHILTYTTSRTTIGTRSLVYLSSVMYAVKYIPNLCTHAKMHDTTQCRQDAAICARVYYYIILQAHLDDDGMGC